MNDKKARAIKAVACFLTNYVATGDFGGSVCWAAGHYPEFETGEAYSKFRMMCNTALTTCIEGAE